MSGVIIPKRILSNWPAGAQHCRNSSPPCTPRLCASLLDAVNRASIEYEYEFRFAEYEYDFKTKSPPGEG